MQYSTNYNMNKPELNEQYRLSHWNENTDIIDSNMKRIDDLESDIQNILDPTFKTALLDFCYPIGSIYWSGVATNPHDLFGGTWEQIKDKFVWAKGDSDVLDAMGGEKTHTLTNTEMPTHTHTFTGSPVSTNGMSGNSSGTIDVRKITGGSNIIVSTSGNCSGSDVGSDYNVIPTQSATNLARRITINVAHTHSVTARGTNANSGGGEAHNNMPPYVVKYCWQRTA